MPDAEFVAVPFSEDEHRLLAAVRTMIHFFSSSYCEQSFPDELDPAMAGDVVIDGSYQLDQLARILLNIQPPLPTAADWHGFAIEWLTYRLYYAPGDNGLPDQWVIADGSGWLPGSFISPRLALEAQGVVLGSSA
jgi:hypothetical protein